MRSICLFINSLCGGGAEHVCVTIANGFSERGWNVKLLTLNLDGKVQFMGSITRKFVPPNSLSIELEKTASWIENISNKMITFGT